MNLTQLRAFVSLVEFSVTACKAVRVLFQSTGIFCRISPSHHRLKTVKGIIRSYKVYTAEIFGFFAAICSCLQDVGLLFTEFSKTSNRACAVELLFGVVAQIGACSSLETGTIFTALVTAFLDLDFRCVSQRKEGTIFRNSTLVQKILNLCYILDRHPNA